MARQIIRETPSQSVYGQLGQALSEGLDSYNQARQVAEKKRMQEELMARDEARYQDKLARDEINKRFQIIGLGDKLREKYDEPTVNSLLEAVNSGLSEGKSLSSLLGQAQYSPEYTQQREQQQMLNEQRLQSGALGLEEAQYKADQLQLDPTQRDAFIAQRELNQLKRENEILKEQRGLKGKKEIIDYTAAVQSKKPKEYKENQYKAGGFARRAEIAMQDFQALPPDIGSRTRDRFYQAAPAELQPSEFQVLDNLKNNFISAVLRKESGAVISPSEFEKEDKKYFAQPGETEEVRLKKARLRQQAINNLKAEAGGAYGQIAEATEVAPIAPQAGDKVSYQSGLQPRDQFTMTPQARAANPQIMEQIETTNDPDLLINFILQGQ